MRTEKNRVELSKKEIGYFQSKIPEGRVSVLSRSPNTPDRLDLSYVTKKSKEFNNSDKEMIMVL